MRSDTADFRGFYHKSPRYRPASRCAHEFFHRAPDGVFQFHIGKKWLVSYYDTNHFSVQHLSYASSITAPSRSCFSPCSRFYCHFRTYPRHTRGDSAPRMAPSQSPEYKPHRQAAFLWSAAVREAQSPTAAFRPQMSALPVRGLGRHQVPQPAPPAAFPYFSFLPLSQHLLSGQLRCKLVLGRVVPPLCLATATRRHTGRDRR